MGRARPTDGNGAFPSFAAKLLRGETALPPDKVATQPVGASAADLARFPVTLTEVVPSETEVACGGHSDRRGLAADAGGWGPLVTLSAFFFKLRIPKGQKHRTSRESRSCPSSTGPVPWPCPAPRCWAPPGCCCCCWAAACRPSVGSTPAPTTP
jgi:hypothetical protein